MNTGTVVFNDDLPLETICNDVVTPLGYDVICIYNYINIVYYIPYSRLIDYIEYRNE